MALIRVGKDPAPQCALHKKEALASLKPFIHPPF